VVMLGPIQFLVNFLVLIVSILLRIP